MTRLIWSPKKRKVGNRNDQKNLSFAFCDIKQLLTHVTTEYYFCICGLSAKIIFQTKNIIIKIWHGNHSASYSYQQKHCQEQQTGAVLLHCKLKKEQKNPGWKMFSLYFNIFSLEIFFLGGGGWLTINSHTYMYMHTHFTYIGNTLNLITENPIMYVWLYY